MSHLLLIPENLNAMSGAAVVAGTDASASMAAANMLTESPSEFWRSLTNAPQYTYAYFTPPGAAYDIEALAVFGHNLTRHDQYRIFTGASTFLAGYTGYNPTSTIAGSTTNTAATFASVDNGETTPSATWAAPTNTNLVWTLGVGFNTPSTAPLTGADRQAFWVYAKAGSTAAENNYIDCYLYEAGVEKVNLGRRYIQSGTGQWLFFTWNASSLSTASGADVECKISMSKINVSTYVQVGSIVWAEDHTARTNDSGWLTFDPWDGDGITFKPQVEGPAAAILYQFPSSVNVSSVHVQFRSCRSPLDYDSEAEKLPTQRGYVQIGTVVLGETWSPAIDRDFGAFIGTKDYSSKARTYGGQLFGSRRFVQRILSLPLSFLTPAEAHTLQDRIVNRHGILKPIVVSILPGDATEEKHTTLLATLRNPETVMNATTTRVYNRSLALEFEEEL